MEIDQQQVEETIHHLFVQSTGCTFARDTENYKQQFEDWKRDAIEQAAVLVAALQNTN